MIIEWLKFHVSPQSQEKFIQKDAEIWTAKLSTYPGFLSKEVWSNPNNPEEIVVIIRWETYQQWKSIPQEALETIEQQFIQQMGTDTYQMIETGEYSVIRN